MKHQEAATVIRVISQSLADNPSQFTIQINVTGEQVTSYAGIGKQIVAIGGAPGSTTVGENVSASFGNAQIRQANKAFTGELDGIVDTLKDIAAELEKSSPDAGRIKRLFNSLGTWVPNVITSVVANVISSAIGHVQGP